MTFDKIVYNIFGALFGIASAGCLWLARKGDDALFGEWE